MPLREWEVRTIPHLQLTHNDEVLLDRFQEGGTKRLEILRLRDGLRVQASSWVGWVRFETFELQIFPKLAGDVGTVIGMLKHAAGLEHLHKYSIRGGVEASGQALFELLVSLFAAECETILRTGLLSDYVVVEDELGVLRGRLLVDRQVLRRFGRFDRLECRFDERSEDVAENRLLVTTLARCVDLVVSSDLRARLRRLLTEFFQTCSIEDGDISTLRRTMGYDRRNAHYREAHELAWFILDGMGVGDIYAGQVKCNAFLFDMNSLFERFLGVWLRRAFLDEGFTIVPSAGTGAVIRDASSGRSYAEIIPDFLIRDQEGIRTLPVDAKYKLYEDRTIDNADLYQLFTYAFAHTPARDDVLPASLLVYPTMVCEKQNTQLHMRTINGKVGASITLIGVSIPMMLQEMEEGFGPIRDEFRGYILENISKKQTHLH